MFLNNFNYFDMYNSEDKTNYKITYLKSIIKNNKLYKFIQFSENTSLNKSKLNMLKNDELWFSFYKNLNDPNEFKVIIDKTKLKNNGVPPQLIDYMKEVYDVCCFTYEYNENMWKEYGNNGNGCCLIFEINENHYDCLHPIMYENKENIDFTKLYIESAKESFNLDSKNPISVLPFVLKDPINQGNGLISRDEKEVRILYAIDESEVNDCIISSGLKEKLNYHGVSAPCAKFGLKLDGIIIGSNCEFKKEIKEICEKKKITISEL